MKLTYDQLLKHLKRTGRVKLLPAILRELKKREEREVKLAPKKETAENNPALISGWRELRDGKLTDTTGKRALIDIYQRIID